MSPWSQPVCTAASALLALRFRDPCTAQAAPAAAPAFSARPPRMTLSTKPAYIRRMAAWTLTVQKKRKNSYRSCSASGRPASSFQHPRRSWPAAPALAATSKDLRRPFRGRSREPRCRGSPNRKASADASSNSSPAWTDHWRRRRANCERQTVHRQQN